MTRFTKDDILQLEKQLRTNLINSLPGVRQANLIGTVSQQGEFNVAIFNSVMHIGAHPPYMGFMMRPVSVRRDTYLNIKSSGYFSINHVNRQMLQQAHQTSARYDYSEFEATGLTAEQSYLHPAPYVRESQVNIGLKFVEEKLIECNQTVLLIGEVIEIVIKDDLLSEDFIVQSAKEEAVAVNGLETYYAVSKLMQLPYAKPV
jgi:flavin reductase (DIM6/NTAB) family NADH-FMN oxidoreductase RutF